MSTTEATRGSSAPCSCPPSPRCAPPLSPGLLPAQTRPGQTALGQSVLALARRRLTHHIGAPPTAPPLTPGRDPHSQPGTQPGTPHHEGALSWTCTGLDNPHHSGKRSTFTPIQRLNNEISRSISLIEVWRQLQTVGIVVIVRKTQ